MILKKKYLKINKIAEYKVFIVQMGLFMDDDGIPLSCEITPGNTNEQTTLQPLE